MFSYTPGFSYKAQRDIYQSDMLEMCQSLGQDFFYQGRNRFRLHPQGGIEVDYLDNPVLHKSVRWNPIMARWKSPTTNSQRECHKPVVYEGRRIFTFLRSIGVSDVFTFEELEIWNYYFREIGLDPCEKNIAVFYNFEDTN